MVQLIAPAEATARDPAARLLRLCLRLEGSSAEALRLVSAEPAGPSAPGKPQCTLFGATPARTGLM